MLLHYRAKFECLAIRVRL